MGLVSWGMEKDLVMILHEGLQSGMDGECKREKRSRKLSTSGPDGDMAVSMLNTIFVSVCVCVCGCVHVFIVFLFLCV